MPSSRPSVPPDRTLHAPTRSPIMGPGLLVAAGAILAVAALHLSISPSNPPGFFRDEAAIALNATTISETLKDEDGARLPLYFTSFYDYKSPVFVYALAAVFRVTGPHAQVARGLAAAGILAAVLLLGLLAYRRTGDRAVGVVTVVIAGTTPWLFEAGRLAFEVSLEPAVLCALLLAIDRAGPRFGSRNAVGIGLTLGLLVYVYAAGRLLAPLCAAALIVFLSRDRLRWLATAWLTFGLTLIPLGVHFIRHEGALGKRLDDVSFVQDGMSRAEIVRTAVGNALRDLNLWHWSTAGDPKPYHHVAGTPSLLLPLVLLAIVGLVVFAWRLRGDLFYRYVVVILLLSSIPAALTGDRFHALRLLPLPVLIVVLAIPAIDLLVQAVRRSRRGKVLAVALCVVASVQLAHFVRAYSDVRVSRSERFEAGVPTLLAQALADGGPVYVDFDDRQPQAHARWYVATRGLPRESVLILPDGGIPPAGSWVFGRTQSCDYGCVEVARSGEYWIARGPARAS